MLELLKTRRSIRKYQNMEVEQEKIDAILKGALMAPSSRGRRPWEFIVVNDKEKIKKLSSCREHASGFLSGAPLAIVVAANADIGSIWVEDAAIAASYMQLMAHSLGLGSCWIHVRERPYDDTQTAEDYVRGILDIPDHIKVLCILAIGYPSEGRPVHQEESLLYDKIHYNRF